MRILKQSHGAEKCKRRNFLGFLNFQFLHNIKTIEGGPFGDQILQKNLTVPKKIEKGDLQSHPVSQMLEKFSC